MLTVVLVLAFAASWVALYILVVRPKLRAYRLTAGIYARLDALEAGWRSRAALLLEGLKVALLGVVTSAAPVVALLYDRMAGFDWTLVLPSERARLVAGAVALAGILGPMAMVALHSGALADAAAVEPQR